MGGRGTVLIVDDDEGMRTLTQIMLKRKGYATVLATDGQDALRIYERGKFSAILSDYQMPNMNGYDFCKKVRALENIPFVMMTAADGLPAFEHPGIPDDIIAKPFDVNDFYRRFEAAINKYKAA